MTEPMRIGEVNYNGYQKIMKWKTFDGREAPTWEQLLAHIKDAWDQGARDVIADANSRKELDVVVRLPDTSWASQAVVLEAEQPDGGTIEIPAPDPIEDVDSTI